MRRTRKSSFEALSLSQTSTLRSSSEERSSTGRSIRRRQEGSRVSGITSDLGRYKREKCHGYPSCIDISHASNKELQYCR